MNRWRPQILYQGMKYNNMYEYVLKVLPKDTHISMSPEKSNIKQEINYEEKKMKRTLTIVQKMQLSQTVPHLYDQILTAHRGTDWKAVPSFQQVMKTSKKSLFLPL